MTIGYTEHYLTHGLSLLRLEPYVKMIGFSSSSPFNFVGHIFCCGFPMSSTLDSWDPLDSLIAVVLPFKAGVFTNVYLCITLLLEYSS